jgi:hypothetical protein
MWINKLEQSKSVGTHKLAHRILREAFKREHTGGQIVLSRKVTGLASTTAVRAARELVKFGLIRIEQSGNKAIRVVQLLFKE